MDDCTQIQIKDNQECTSSPKSKSSDRKKSHLSTGYNLARVVPVLLSMKMNSMEDLASQSIKKRNKNRSVETKSVLGGGKLLIELKISKDGGEEDTEDPNIERLLHKDQMSQNSVCDLCNKTFKSGKALGGHMRIHSPKGKQKKLIFKNKLKVNRYVICNKQNPRAADNFAGAFDIDKRPSCPVCRKVFISMKSVYGHMWKHPDRNWRGSRPPSIEKTSSDSCLSYEETPENSDQDELLAYGEKNGGVDLTVHLTGWNSTARRGRNRLSWKMDDFQLKELEAVAGLMMLAGRDFESGDLGHGQKGGEFEDVKSILDAWEPSIIGREGCDVSLNDVIKNPGSKILIKNKKKRKKVKLSDLELPPNATSSSSQEIDLNKLPASECEAEIETK